MRVLWFRDRAAWPEVWWPGVSNPRGRRVGPAVRPPVLGAGAHGCHTGDAADHTPSATLQVAAALARRGWSSARLARTFKLPEAFTQLMHEDVRRS